MNLSSPKITQYFALGKILVLGLFLFYCREENWLYEMRNQRLEKIYGRKNLASDIRRLEKEIQKIDQDVKKLYEKIGQKAHLYRQLALLFAQSGAFSQCVEHVKLSERYGSIDADLRQLEGLCLGNLASQKGWDRQLAKEAEKAYLIALELNPNLSDAKLELAILYIYGIAPKELDEENKNFYYKKAQKLLQEYSQEIPNDHRGYQLLAQIYILENNLALAKKELLLALEALKRQNPKNYSETQEYQEIKKNLEKLP